MSGHADTIRNFIHDDSRSVPADIPEFQAQDEAEAALDALVAENQQQAQEIDRLRRLLAKVLPQLDRNNKRAVRVALAGTPSEDAYTNPAMWQQVRLDSDAYVWVFLCASDEAEPWNLAFAGTPSEDTG